MHWNEQIKSSSEKKHFAQLKTLIYRTDPFTHLSARGLYKDFSPEALERSARRSMRNLGLDPLPLLQLHSPSCDQMRQAIDHLVKLKQRGMVRYIGVSVGNATAQTALELSAFDCVMLTYNVMEKELSETINVMARKGIGVLVKSPMAHTVFSNKRFQIRRLSDLWYVARILKNYRKMLKQRAQYRFMNETAGFSASEIALKYVLNHPGVGCAVIGTTRPEHLQENVATLDKTVPADVIRKIDGVV